MHPPGTDSQPLFLSVSLSLSLTPALPPSRHTALAPRHSLQGTEHLPPSPRNPIPRRGTSLHDPDMHGGPTLTHSLQFTSALTWQVLLPFLLPSNVMMQLVIGNREY